MISKNNENLQTLKSGVIIGTGSSRRSEQLKLIREDLEIVPIRGNIDTRINKVFTTDIDGVVLANAGVKRLGLDNHVSQIFDVEEIVPSPLQGFLAIEAREDSDVSRYFESLSLIHI